MVNELERDDNNVPVAGGVSSADSTVILPFKISSSTGRLLVDVAAGSGTVTDVSVVTANGFAGTVATSTTTPAITFTTTVTGILSGNGTAISAASTTGSGAVVLANTPTLITPNIGAATGTSLSVSGALTSATSLVLEETGAGTDTITIQAPASIAASYTLTLPIDDGASGEVLSTNGSGVLSWVSAGGVPTTITVANEATDTSCFIAFFTAATGDLGPKTNANLTFNSNTGVLTAGQAIAGSITGNAATVTVADAGGDTTTFVLLGTDATGSLTPATDAGLTFNATTNVLTASGGFSGNITGNAATVTFANEATDTSCFIAFGTAATGSLPVSTNTNMTFNSNTGVATFASTVLTTTDINGGTIDGTVIGGAAAAAGTFTLATAEGFSPTSTTATGNRMYLPAANTIGFAINGTGEVQLTATALSPIADGGNSLGTTALGWQNLFGNTGFVLNIENSDWVATHTTGILTVGTGDLRVTNAGTNSASAVTVGGTQTLTAKTLTAPTIGGVTTLSAAATIQLTIPGSDGTCTGPTTSAFVSGYTSSAIGDLVYLDSSAKWQKADADAASTASNMLGIALAVAATDAALLVALPGSMVYATAFPTLTIGAPYYVGETAGAIQATIPTGADNVIRVVGFGIHADKLFFMPSSDNQTTVA